MALRPLDGHLVGITADRRWSEQAELLARRGASVLHGPTIDTQYLASEDDLRRASQRVIREPPDYLVVTTGIGMRAWLEAASAWGQDDQLLAALSRARIVARGPKAAGALEGGGLAVWGRSADERLEGVASLLLDQPLAGRTVAVQEHGLPSPRFTAVLAGAGARVIEVPVYRWRVPPDTGPAERLVEAACDGRLSAITFTSAPALHSLFSIAGASGRGDDLRRACNGRVTAACIGPVCAEGAVEEGIDAPLAPEVGRLGLLVRVLGDHLAARRRTFRLGGADLVLQGSTVEVGPVRADLAPLEQAVFEVLAERPGAVVSRGALLRRVWGRAGDDPHVLDVTMGRLRRRLRPAGEVILTSPGRGYRLAVDPA
jgi:uroporphyrinogen-III synthase